MLLDFRMYPQLRHALKGVRVVMQVTNALQRNLGNEEKLLAEVQRDKDRFDQRKNLENQVT